MSAKITIANGKATLDAKWTAEIPKMQVTIENFAHNLWDRNQGNHGTEEEPVVWEDLDNQTKIDIWFDYVTTMTVNDAKAYGRKTVEKVAGDQEDIDAENKYGLID